MLCCDFTNPGEKKRGMLGHHDDYLQIWFFYYFKIFCYWLLTFELSSFGDSQTSADDLKGIDFILNGWECRNCCCFFLQVGPSVWEYPLGSISSFTDCREDAICSNGIPLLRTKSGKKERRIVHRPHMGINKMEEQEMKERKKGRKE